ncbi:MAG: hypothetical protein MH204_12425, partial [Fimbriimonadaceae bacterium]|nr:hypothetical protein [Fimbriimonadaceae bacterium]
LRQGELQGSLREHRARAGPSRHAVNLPALPADRAEAREALQRVVYGPVPEPVSVPGRDRASGVVDGLGVWRIVELALPGGRILDCLVCLPDRPSDDSVWFCGLNFDGNQSICRLEGVPENRSWSDREVGLGGLPWAFSVETILAAGHALVTCHVSDVCPDRPDLAAPVLAATAPGLGAVGMWAWGLASMALSLAPPGRAVLVGPSRLGKAALCAGALFDGWLGVAPIQSGTGGASPWRKGEGETLAQITSAFPHWFAPSLSAWAGRESEMPLDQHWALASVEAPGLLALGAEEDRWADPDGQARLIEAARPWAPAGALWESRTRPGRHEVTEADWQPILSWADRLQG